MGALIGGIVEFDEATECVFLLGDGFRTLIVWPPDTNFNWHDDLVISASP
jgi:hypothetical protein